MIWIEKEPIRMGKGEVVCLCTSVCVSMCMHVWCVLGVVLLQQFYACAKHCFD